MNKLSLKYICFLLLFAMLFSSGCFLAPVIQSVKDAGLTKGDRAVLLDKRVGLFHNALYWGRYDDAVAFADPENFLDIQNSIRATKKRDQKIVEHNIDFMSLSEDGYEADVEVVVRYFDIPVYVVQERVEKEKWVFSTLSGWKIASRSVEALS